ncbi:MAG: 50S ribosomal protein L23 [Candidatus Kuenenbacteria bacterium]
MNLFNKFKKKIIEKDIEKDKKEKKENKKIEKVEIQKKTESNKINYKDAYRILVRPISTEKATNLMPFNQYIFEVAKNSNKNEIKKAIQAVYNVKPIKVNTVKIKGKSVRHGKTKGRTKDWKKAIITLKQGEKIEVFESH